VTKWLKIDQDNLRMKFLVLNVDFSSPSSIPYVQGGRRKQAAKTAAALKVAILPQLDIYIWLLRTD